VMTRNKKGHLAYRSQMNHPLPENHFGEDWPMILEDKVHGLRLQVIRRAAELGVLPGDDFLSHSGMAKVSTPFRIWTV
jgi:hypothetical protein